MRSGKLKGLERSNLGNQGEEKNEGGGNGGRKPKGLEKASFLPIVITSQLFFPDSGNLL